MGLDNRPYATWFEKLSRTQPYGYQARLFEVLPASPHTLIRVPTGCGKTLAVVAPFLLDRLHGESAIGARRLIYVLPMRTLVRAIERDICDLVERAKVNCTVTVQTGEEPGDPYLDQGDIVVTTFDQFLSGMLCGPYGLSDRQFNVNAAAAIGNLIVFDEFHLMEPDKAFLTSVSMMHLFRDWTRTVWMTATATSPLVDALRDALTVEEITLSDEDEAKIPAIAEVHRQIVRVHEPLFVEHVLRHKGKRVVAVVNQVKRAQRLFEDLKQRSSELGIDTPIRCLHSRFFRSHRNATEAWLREAFGKKATEPAILITTQAVEAGVDISAEALLTEMAPANSLMQRAGRCARYPKQSGIVEVFDLPAAPSAHLPYCPELMHLTCDALGDGGVWSPSWATNLVEEVHHADDSLKVKNRWLWHLGECSKAIRDNLINPGSHGVARLIREGTDQTRAVIAKDPSLHHGRYEPIQIYRSSLEGVAKKRLDALLRWDFDEQRWAPLGDANEVDQSLILAISPEVAGYTPEAGLKLMDSTSWESPLKEISVKQGWRPMRKEAWEAHSRIVRDRAEEMLSAIGAMVNGAPVHRDALRRWMQFAAVSHDLGKLQRSWQQWARAYQRCKTGSQLDDGELLAHTDFDYSNPADRLLQREIVPKRPNHSEASAWYASGVSYGSPEDLDLLKPAALLAVLGHHGGWWNRPVIEPLTGGAWKLCEQLGLPASRNQTGPKRPESEDFLDEWLEGPLTDPARFVKLWPIAALFVRILRLADQASLEEANADR